MLDLLFPVRCSGCDRPTGDPVLRLCFVCRRFLVQPPLPWTNLKPDVGPQELRIFSLWSYERFGPARSLQHRLKYGGETSLGRRLGFLLADAILNDMNVSRHCVYLVPVPIHPVRRRERGYNQAEIIAEGFAARLDLVVRTDMIARTRLAGSQVGTDRTERRQNLSGAFTPVCSLSECKGSAFLIDDVLTTGSTLNAAAQALHLSGLKIAGGATIFRRTPEY